MSAILAPAGVGAAAGALIAFSFAMSPPLTLLPSRPADANGNPPLHRSVGIADTSADGFDDRWHEAFNGIQPMPASKGNDLLDLQDLAGLSMPSIAPARAASADPDEFESVSKPAQNSPAALVLRKPAARLSDVCTRNGLYRIEYTRNDHRYWRCLHRQHTFPVRRTASDARPIRFGNQVPSGNEPQPFFQSLRGFFFQSTQ